MVVYNFLCDKEHRFEGWFASTDEFAVQERDGGIACPVCGSSAIVRQPSAPYVNTRAGQSADHTPSAPTPEAIEWLREKFVEHVLKNTEDVGRRFPEEARRIHYQETPARSIRGKASSEEVDALRDEGIEVHALPGLPVPPDQLH
jgi:hypothetical protein